MFPYFVHRNLNVQVLAIFMKSIVKLNKFMWSPLSLAAGSSKSYLQQDFDLKSR